MSEQVATPEQIEQADEEALLTAEAYLTPDLDWRGLVGLGLIATAIVLVWRMP